MKENISISMTNFVDFVITSGNPRITQVKNIRNLYGEKYKPHKDYWRILREEIINYHKKGEAKVDLDGILSNIENSPKEQNYGVCIASYKRWLGRKKINWIGSSKTTWCSDRLCVKVNPELGLSIDGKDYAIKLYFRAKKLSKTRIDTILYLIRKSLPKSKRFSTPGILDVQRGKLFIPTRKINGIDILLEGEVSGFLSMWDGFDE